MVFLKVVLVGLASPRGLTVQCFPQEYFSPTPPFHFRCVGPYNKDADFEVAGRRSVWPGRLQQPVDAVSEPDGPRAGLCVP